MTLWIDAQLSPALARWITEHFEGLEAAAVRELGLREAEDVEIFFRYPETQGPMGFAPETKAS